jgi:L-asparagine transporter-like permease
MNTDIYLCSRMLFSLSRGGLAPPLLGRLSRSGVPIAAILLSGGGILIAAAVSKLTPKAYSYLFGIALFGAIVVWIIILLSHLSFRRRIDVRSLSVRMPGYPWVQYAGIALLSAVLVTMGTDKDWWLSWIVGVPWLALLTVAYFLLERRAWARSLSSPSGGSTGEAGEGGGLGEVFAASPPPPLRHPPPPAGEESRVRAP